MIVCPVCEHAQAQGAECEVCGRKLLHGAAAIPAVPPLEGLEPTRLDEAVDAPADSVPDLEPTLAAAVDVDAPPVADVEPTLAAPVDVDAAAIPDIERTSAEIPGDEATPLPITAVCRYCRTPAMPGERICGRCGMRLPVLDAPPTSAPGQAEALCPSCGAPAAGPRCRSCGGRISTGS